MLQNRLSHQVGPKRIPSHLQYKILLIISNVIRISQDLMGKGAIENQKRMDIIPAAETMHPIENAVSLVVNMKDRNPCTKGIVETRVHSRNVVKEVCILSGANTAVRLVDSVLTGTIWNREVETIK